MVKTIDELPTFDELPTKGRYWAWGPDEHEEALGKLNLLTAEHVAKSAKSEIVTGERVGLGWELQKPEYPSFNRQHFHMEIRRRSPNSFDDIYTFNPQQSSQWDGFRHYMQPITFSEDPKDIERVAKEKDVDGVWFSGVTSEEINAPGSTRIGMHHWAKQGIVGRGVLLDYALYAEQKGIKYSCFETNKITLTDLLNVAEHFKVKIQPADILVIRIGLTKEWDSLTDAQKKEKQARDPAPYMGLEPSDDMLRWIWNNHFPAVASDAVALEHIPNADGLRIHQHLLAGWGVTIGEIFNLEPLSALCQKLNRYSFFVSSVPLNSVGGVSSPPNAVAIF